MNAKSVFLLCRTGTHLDWFRPSYGLRVFSASAFRAAAQDDSADKSSASPKSAKISRAMREYVRKAEEYTTLISNEQSEFELGKRHLANIMGFDEDAISQQQIDAAISYLLPSGLFEPRSRPIMKPPEEIFPKRKPAQFGIDGRPYHFLFYTGKPNFYELMNEGATWMKRLNEPTRRKSVESDVKSSKIDLTGSDWIDLPSLRSMTLENVEESDRKAFVSLLTRVALHQNSENAREFIFRFRQRMTAEKPSQLRLPIMSDASGKRYVDSFGTRKWARADVRLFAEGTGLIKINGKSLLEHFPGIYEREQILFPLQFSGMLGKVDFVASINSGASGSMAEAGALRLALARALCSVCSDDVVDSLRLAGLLTRDNRRRERKKPGQIGARRKFTWVKR